MQLRFLLSTALLFLIGSLFGQFSKTVHHTFEADSAQTITINIEGEVIVEAWEGNTVLVETNIRLYNASKSLFEFMVEEQGRYEVLGNISGQTLAITSKDSERRIIQTKKGQANEEIFVRVRLPKKFTGEGSGPYARKADEGR
ncbi:MAG: hypothetical protein AB8F78_07320 [Saprospiraceae bacterium]